MSRVTISFICYCNWWKILLSYGSVLVLELNKNAVIVGYCTESNESRELWCSITQKCSDDAIKQILRKNQNVWIYCCKCTVKHEQFLVVTEWMFQFRISAQINILLLLHNDAIFKKERGLCGFFSLSLSSEACACMCLIMSRTKQTGNCNVILKT